MVYLKTIFGDLRLKATILISKLNPYLKCFNRLTFGLSVELNCDDNGYKLKKKVKMIQHCRASKNLLLRSFLAKHSLPNLR